MSNVLSILFINGNYVFTFEGYIRNQDFSDLAISMPNIYSLVIQTYELKVLHESVPHPTV